jgi:phosphoribosylglycinamide formyltransferase-1
MASGKGSNAQNIINFFKESDVNVNLIITDALCGATTVAKDNKIDHVILTNWKSIIPIIKGYNPDLVILAGFLKMVPTEFLNEFKTINIHPSLLPKFGGKGMWGLNVHKKVIESGESESGITIHWVNNEYDKGEIISQYKVVTSAGTQTYNPTYNGSIRDGCEAWIHPEDKGGTTCSRGLQGQATRGGSPRACQAQIHIHPS